MAFLFPLNYSLSIIAAAPIPVPIHIEVTINLKDESNFNIPPTFFPCRFNSGKRVAICLAPVQPKGCPSAIAPPEFKLKCN
jgi:hypothetical protein